ncbi:AfsR/SARP family transcriptional regulator [Nocardioides dilutus]
MTSTLLLGERARPVAAASVPATPALVVRTLGSFAVLRDGVPLSVSDWHSRKVRDLFKILVARRGRALTRDAVLELLWPDSSDRDEQVRSRLSVTLSTLRRVLDPDRRYAVDHYVVADGRALALRTEHARIDLVGFLDTVARAEDAADRDDWGVVDQLLAGAQAAYPGDFLEEDLFEDWAVDTREHARSAALRAGRLRVDGARSRADHEGAARHLEWLLGLDPFDEPAWLWLLDELRALRRHGEVRRQHARYSRRMREIGVVPRPL